MAPCASKTAPAAASSLRVGRETDTELLRVSGLKYTYAVLEQQINGIMVGVVDKVMPAQGSSFPPPEFGTAMQKSYSGACGVELERVLHDVTRKQRLARQAIKRADEITKDAEKLSKLVDFYIHVMDSIRKALEREDEIVQPVILQNGYCTASRYMEPQSKSGLIKPTRTDASARVSCYDGRTKPRNVKAKAPPPKPAPRPVTEEEFLGVSPIVRGKVKLSDVNQTYKVLYQVFCDENLEKIKLSDLAKRGVGVAGRTEFAKLTVLRQVRRIAISNDQQYISPADL